MELLLADYLACDAFFKSCPEVDVRLQRVVNELIDIVRCICLKAWSSPTVGRKPNAEHPLQSNHFNFILLFAQLVEKTFKKICKLICNLDSIFSKQGFEIFVIQLILHRQRRDVYFAPLNLATDVSQQFRRGT